MAEQSKKRSKREKEVLQKKLNIAKYVFMLSIIVFIGSIIIGIVQNVNRIDTSKAQGKAVTVEGIVRGVREQQDIEEQTNAVVTVTKYHLEVGVMYKDEERVAITDEAYSSREYAEKFIGETREITVDDKTFMGLPEKSFNYTFLIGIFIGVIGAICAFLYTYKYNGVTRKISIKHKVKDEDDSVDLPLTPIKAEEEA